MTRWTWKCLQPAELTSLWKYTLCDDVSQFFQSDVGVPVVLWVVDEEPVALFRAAGWKTHEGRMT